MDKTVTVLCSAALVFIGASLYDTAQLRRGKKPLTDFQRFLFGTGFSYVMIVFWEMLQFFVDYYVKGSELQHFNSAPGSTDLFLKLFGVGKSGEAQFPVWDIDTDFLCCVLGAALGGAALLIVSAVKNKRNGDYENGLFYGMKKTPDFSQYIKNEFETFRSQISVFEYICWWILRGLLIYMLVKEVKEEGFGAHALQFSANIGVTFIIPVTRVLFFKKLFFGNINFRVQSYIDLIIFLGNFLGIGVGWTGEIENYDKFVHFISGAITVAIGLLLIEGIRAGKGLPKTTKAAASCGFSCVVMVLWEVFEFIADFVMADSQNQNWSYNPSGRMLFYEIFGYGAQNPGQLGVFDTDLDIFFAAAGTAFAAASLIIVLAIKEKRSVVKLRAEVKA